VQKIGLYMVTLLYHTSHALRPLDVNCFKEQEFKNFTCSFHFANNWQLELKIKAQ
jgi:hypothetical protein